MTPDRIRRTKTLLSACLLEAACAGAVVLGGFGPCGPTNPAGYIGLLAHLPAMLVLGPLSMWITLPSAIEFMAAAAIQVGVFAAIIGALRRARIAARNA
jgi:hypothetical protein